MNAQAVLAELRSRVEHLEVVGDRIRWRPASRVPVELVEEIKRYKRRLLELLAAPAVGDVLGEIAVEGEPLTAAGGLARMPLAEFASAHLVLEVYSHVLREVVIFASDNATVDPERARGRGVYRAVELEHLHRLGIDRAELAQLHLLKRLFGASVLTS